jgi:peptidyl-prolyl cis-trans isomerase D
MRQNASSWIIKLLLGAIVVVFVLWGVGTNQKSSNPEVASVEGQPISYADFAQAYSQLVDNVRRRFGNDFDEDTLKALGLKEQALNQLIDRAVLIKEAKVMGFRVSDEELAAHILAVPAFQRNGQFDRAQYERVLAQLRMTPEMFEAAQHDDLLISKLSDVIARTAKVAEGEAIDWHRWQNATVNLDYVVFAPDQETIIPPDDDEVRTFFEENKSRYQTPPKRSARYLVFRAADYRPQVRLADDEVAAFYAEHIDEFKTPETIDARHILFKVAQDADDAAVEAARAKADDVHRQIMDGGDFEELARTHSEEAATGANGGFLGTFGRGQMVKPFEEAAFALEAGQVSAPVRTQFGYHIIKVDKQSPAGTRTLAEAENKIRGQMTDRRARALALEDAEAAYDLSYENEDLAAVAEQLGQPLQTTGKIARNDAIEGVADKATFGRILFELDADGISEVQEIDGDFYIVQVQTIEASQVPALEAVKARVVEDWKQELRWEQAESQAKAFLQALKDGGAIEALSKERALELKQTGFFKRNEAIADIGYQPEMAAAAFAFSKENPLPEKPVRSNDGFYVFRFRERQQPEGNVDQGQLGQTRKQLLQRKQRQLFEDWTAEARERADIQVDRSVLE